MIKGAYTPSFRIKQHPLEDPGWLLSLWSIDIDSGDCWSVQLNFFHRHHLITTIIFNEHVRKCVFFPQLLFAKKTLDPVGNFTTSSTVFGGVKLPADTREFLPARLEIWRWTSKRGGDWKLLRLGVWKTASDDWVTDDWEKSNYTPVFYLEDHPS